jgi:hypothetical protein
VGGSEGGRVGGREGGREREARDEEGGRGSKATELGRKGSEEGRE